MSFRYGDLRDSIVASVRKSVEGEDVGIACSGGLDSGLVAAIAKDYADSVTLYTCGAERSHDVLMAEDLSRRLELPWVHAVISKRNTEIRLKEMIAASETFDPFTLSYELQLFCVCREAKQDIILTGQGADEYFMGCAKYVDQPDEDYETLKEAGVRRLLDVSIPCEARIAKHFGKDLRYPYMDPAVLSEIDRIDPSELKPKDMDSRKSVLKEVAADLGYPTVAERKKKSSQYGSGTTDLVRMIAREKGMMYNQYIESLCSELSSKLRPDACIYLDLDPGVKESAEKVLEQYGISPSEAVGSMYRSIAEGDADFIAKICRR